MEKEENKSGSVYVTVDGHFNPIHISMKGKGKEGFLDFMQEDVEKALRGKEIPTTGVLYYDVPDLAMVPPLRKRNNSNYLKSLEKAMGWAGNRIAKLPVCIGSGVLPVKNIDPLSKDEHFKRILTPGMWEEIQSSPKMVEKILDDLKRGNHYYSAVETDKGVLLFDDNTNGEWQFNSYMYEYVEKSFFEPDFPLKSLAVHELSGWPSLMEGKVNLCKNERGDWVDEETMRLCAYQDRSVLKNVVESKTFDLAPTWENYFNLTEIGEGLGLPRSPDNYDRMTLPFHPGTGIPGGRAGR